MILSFSNLCPSAGLPRNSGSIGTLDGESDVLSQRGESRTDYEGNCRATEGEITGSPTTRPRQSLGHGAQGSLDQRLCVPAFRSGLPFSKLSGLRVNASHSAVRISLTLLMHVCNLSRSKRGRGDAATNGISWETDGQGLRTRQIREYASGETPFGLDVTTATFDIVGATPARKQDEHRAPSATIRLWRGFNSPPLVGDHHARYRQGELIGEFDGRRV